MRQRVELKIGDKVDVWLGKGTNTYRTILEDITEEGLLLISAPLYRGIPVIMHREQEMELYFYRQNGRFCIDVQVIDFMINGPVRMIILRQLSEPRKQQRRESFRFPVELKVVIRDESAGPFPEKKYMEDPEEQEDSITENISETGVRVRTRNKYVVGDRLYLRLFFNWPTPEEAPLEVYGEVTQVVRHEREENIFCLGIKFLDCSDETRQYIARFVMVRQQAVIKQQKLVEGDDEE